VKRFKIIVAVTIALLGGQSAFAQWNGSVGAGYATTSFTGADCSTFLSGLPMNGFYAGATREYYFSALAGLTFEPGFYYYYQSARNELLGSDSKYIKMHYVSMPFNIKYTLEFAPALRASLITGPVMNIGLFGDLYEDKFVTNKSLDKATRHLTRVNAQWDFGFALTIAEAVQVRLGYALGLSRLIPEQEVRSNTFTVGAAILF